MLYRLALIDDNKRQFDIFSRRFKKLEKDIELLFVENCTTCEDVLDWIIENKIECLLVDYKLTNKYNFTGAQLINYVNGRILDLPCVILTSYMEDAEDEKLVMKPLIFDKNIMTESKDSDQLREFIRTLIHSIQVFRKRMELNKDEYKDLLEKNKNEKLNSKEYERFENLFKMLKSYDIIDDISVVSINMKFDTQMDNLINKIDKLLNK